MKERDDKGMPSAEQDESISLQLNVLVEKQADGTYLSHCLELDLVADGDTPDAACEELLNLIDVQVRTCLENDNLENLFFPAPQEVWRKLGSAKQRCRQQTRHRTIPVGTKRGKPSRTVQVDQYCYV